jgi:hypothetical protein
MGGAGAIPLDPASPGFFPTHAELESEKSFLLCKKPIKHPVKQ